MSVKASHDSYRTQAFVLRRDDLQKLHKIIYLADDVCSFEIVCTDGLTREFRDLNELLEYENPPSKAIRTLSIESRSGDWNRSASIRFSAKDRDNIHIRLRGSEEEVSKYTAKIDDFFPSVSPWYGWISITRFVAIAYALGVFILVIAALSGYVSIVVSESPLDKVRFMFYNMGIFYIPLAVGSLLNKLRDWAFPLSVFAIGQGNERHQRKERLREILITAIILPAVGYALLWAYNRIFS
jgi:hypothetical protein